MYLKSLTIKGFKSFAQSTTFEFEPGVTAIVGPNGSGKSNVVDALAWVMGEQGAKSLRGGKMEDVIFAGTSTRGPLGRAEVRLTIDNSDGALPIEYSEVTISRTLFRNGASEYAINGDGCRLLDVQELLSDSGLGREMHVIVGQGQLDAVLRATPEDRRGFIEEAAGILKHRRRKERTLRKLEAMETNLTRLNDLAGEIRRQLKPLGRQAEVARQAQAIAAEVRDARARLLADDVVRLREELRALTRDEAEQHSARIVLQEQIEQKQLRMQRLELEQQSDELDARRRVTLGLESAQAKLRGVFAQTQQRLTFLATQAEPPEQLNRLTRAAVQEAAEEATKLADGIPATEAAWQEARQHTQRAQHALDAVDEHLAAQSALVSQHDLELSQLRGRAEAAEQKRAAVAQETARRELALTQAQERFAAAQQQLADFEAEQQNEATSEDALEQNYRDAVATQATAERVRDEAREVLHRLEQERAGLDAKISALARSLDQRDASGALLTDAPAGILGRVSDEIRVDPGYEAAVAAALGRFADALLATDADAAHAAVATAHRDGLGRVDVVIAQPRTAASRGQIAPDLPGVVRAGDVTRGPDGVMWLLQRSFIATNLASAARAAAGLREAFPDGAYTVVTRDGDVLTAQTLTGGSGVAPSRIELAAEHAQAVQRREELAAETEERAAQLRELRDAATHAKQAAERAVAELRAADAQQAAIAEQRNRLVVRAEASQAEAERAGLAREAVAESIADAQTAVDQAARALAEAEARPRPMFDAGERETLAHEVERAREAEIERRLELETARERARAAAARHALLRDQLEAERQAAEESARRAVLRARQVARAEEVARLLPEIQASCDRALAEARLAQQAAEQDRARHSQELTLLRAEEAELRQRLHALTERVHGAELQSYERKLQLSSLLERAGNELGLVEDVLVAEYGPSELIPIAAPDPESEERTLVPFVREDQQKRLARAEKQLAELGRINPLALEEYAALEQRHAFLSGQLQDLTRTRADLMTIINDLDDKMQGIFAAAFADTQAAFSEVFPVLFPGGSGEIFLSDPDDLLRTGIEMTVRPAGKKVERLSLLSGGERSLAAVAWLIAIFQARPSPFYIMDEVEAALDDANLGRLLQTFERLRENSQLIVITHQKRTMEIADALYGVSMRQDGISAVVGQRLRSEDETVAE